MSDVPALPASPLDLAEKKLRHAWDVYVEAKKPIVFDTTVDDLKKEIEKVQKKGQSPSIGRARRRAAQAHEIGEEHGDTGKALDLARSLSAIAPDKKAAFIVENTDAIKEACDMLTASVEICARQLRKYASGMREVTVAESAAYGRISVNLGRERQSLVIGAGKAIERGDEFLKAARQLEAARPAEDRPSQPPSSQQTSDRMTGAAWTIPKITALN